MRKPAPKKPAAKPAAKKASPAPQTTVATVGASKPTAAQKKEERRWAAQDALRTLQRAEEIKRDKALMGDVQRHAREQVAVAQKFAGGKGKSA